jgi:hypothetical protein
VPWFIIAAFVVGLIASLFLAPKPKLENARASTLSDLNFPRAKEGDPKPWIIGKIRNKGPNTLWAGDFEARPIKKKVKTGLFTSKKQIVGYNYLVGLVMDWGLGPGVTLHKIWSAKDVLWSGTATADGTIIDVNKPDLYGGKEKGGGFVGRIRYYSGSFTQGINAYYQSKQGSGDVPAYRGSIITVFEHVNVGEQNTIREISAELSRYPNGLGLAGGKHIVGEDANPMEALYQLFTADWGGLDVSPAMLDLDSMIDCGNTLFDEGNGISLIISNPNDGKGVATEILRQINAIMYNDPETGKIVVKLIRDDFGDIDLLPHFNESNILGIRSFTRKLWEDTINVVRVTYTNRDKLYADGTAMQQDMANIGAQGRLRPSTASYPGITTAVLANFVCARDLAVGSVPLMSAQIECNREGSKLRPGDRFVWSWGPYNINQVVMRVTTFDLGSLTDNRITWNCVQDEFAISDTLIGDPVGSGTSVSGPGYVASSATNRIVKEVPFFFAAAAGLGLPDSSSLLLVAASAATGTDSMDIYTSTDAGVTYNESAEGLVLTPIGTLGTAISAVANLATGVIPSLSVTIDPTLVDQNTATLAASGGGMFLIGNELFVFETRTTGSGVVTLNNVWRSVLDTSPAAHAIGDAVFFITGDNIVEDAFPNTATVRVKMLPNMFQSSLDEASAPFDSITLNKRSARPLPPEAIKFGAGAFFAPPAAATGIQTITWANRSRLGSKVRKIIDLTNEFEPNQQTVIRYRIGAGAWVATNFDPGITTASIDTGVTAGTREWQIYAVRDGLESWASWGFVAGAADATSTSPDTGGTTPADPATPGGPTTPPDPYTPPTDADITTASQVSLVFPFGEFAGTYAIDLPITYPITIPAGLVGTNVDHKANPTIVQTFTLKKITALGTVTTVGSVAISTGGVYTLTAASDIVLVAGDTLSCQPPAVEDTALRGATISVAGRKS